MVDRMLIGAVKVGMFAKGVMPPFFYLNNNGKGQRILIFVG